MKKCPKCGTSLQDDIRFCPECGSECSSITIGRAATTSESENLDQLVGGNNNLINESTIIGRQDKYEASNITIHNNLTEDHSHTTVVCAVSGKRIYMDHSVVCPKCSKPVAMEYYVETSKRCEKCEQEAQETFRTYATRVMGEGALDSARKRQLDIEARRLQISDDAQVKILRELQQTPDSKSVTLSTVQQAELEGAIKRLQNASTPKEVLSAWETLSVLHDGSQNYTVAYWYFLALAIIKPTESIKRYEAEITDNYWQRFWGFLPYCEQGSPKGGAAIDRLRQTFSEHDDDLRLAETIYFIARGCDVLDKEMLSRANELFKQIRETDLSQPLKAVYHVLERFMAEGISLDNGAYTQEEMFIFVHILRLGKVIQELAEAQEARAKAAREAEEQTRREAEARREAEEQARRAAEQRRAEQQAALAADRSQRMAEELNRLNGGKQPPKTQAGQSTDKAFAGYDTPIPARKGGWKRNVLIVLLVLLLILIALFLIPAPESMQ